MRDIAVVMITVDRFPATNYFRSAIQNLIRGRMFTSSRLQSFTVVDSGSPHPLDHLSPLLGVWASYDTATQKRNPTENVIQALELGASKRAKWVLFLEDDIDVCGDFLDSIGAWLDEHEVIDRLVYSFGVCYDEIERLAQEGKSFWNYPVDSFYGTCCFAVHRENAESLAEYLKRDVSITSYDLTMAAWAKTWGQKFFLASVPSFVQHIGAESGIRPGSAPISYSSWPGATWSYLRRLENGQRNENAEVCGQSGQGK
jgi:hypothetical protein